MLQYFTIREWEFDNTNFLNLWNSDLMSAKDKELFNMDFFSLDIEEFMRRCMFGARVYCMKEPASSIPRCRKQLKM